jgi:hypothetical protein
MEKELRGFALIGLRSGGCTGVMEYCSAGGVEGKNSILQFSITPFLWRRFVLKGF